ncbi:YceI family protein [Corynebacterium glyciniphilum]|uniref:YceI family protein n=1 Tax=Corynebacterium glyciniphilum TaxID=1404244 RepID=UPI0026526F74|nr:YceI family protein [Corynebacterium glyciniphilum]MDN6704834.1 YceI family protein [Corynebacterium glyciniphilum]
MRKGIVTLVVVTVVALAIAIVGPPVYRLLTSEGLQTASIADGSGEPATVGVDGHWDVVSGAGENSSEAGYTFDEVLPGQEKSTSGRTSSVSGSLVVNDGILEEGRVTVDVDSIESDIEKRDIHVRDNILHTDQYPEATFTISDPVDLSSLPEDGSVDTVTVNGELTMHGKTNDVTAELTVLRTGENVIVEGQVPVEREAFGIVSPEFVASQIAEEGTVDLLLVFGLQS